MKKSRQNTPGVNKKPSRVTTEQIQLHQKDKTSHSFDNHQNLINLNASSDFKELRKV
jgi:hypothetical protein